jgi:hypothetical protein
MSKDMTVACENGCVVALLGFMSIGAPGKETALRLGWLLAMNPCCCMKICPNIGFHAKVVKLLEVRSRRMRYNAAGSKWNIASSTHRVSHEPAIARLKYSQPHKARQRTC